MYTYVSSVAVIVLVASCGNYNINMNDDGLVMFQGRV